MRWSIFGTMFWTHHFHTIHFQTSPDLDRSWQVLAEPLYPGGRSRVFRVVKEGYGQGGPGGVRDQGSKMGYPKMETSFLTYLILSRPI